MLVKDLTIIIMEILLELIACIRQVTTARQPLIRLSLDMA